jgi:formylglycine-generating enzyme required for sulfatase activity/serine/threonine protein kinase
MTIDQFYLRYAFDSKHDRLGSGAFGTVYKAYDNVLNLYKAIKIAKVQSVNGKEFSLLSEFQNVKNIPPHTNIANYEAVYQFQNKHEVTDYAVMQFYEDGTLKDILQRENLNPAQKTTIIFGLLNGVSHLHKAGIVHRDLKAGNILMARDQKGEFIPKISDFGLSKLLDYGLDESLSNSFQGGSIDYSSPEQFMGLKLMQNTDIWSLGVMLFEIFTGRKPFQGDGPSITPEIKRHTTLVKIFKGQISEHINLCPDPYKDIIQLSLRLDPYKRIRNVDQIFKFLEFPELLNNPLDTELWDEDETVIFGFEEENRRTFPIVFHRFLVDLGIVRPDDAKEVDKNNDEKLIAERKKYVDDKNFELKELKVDVQNLLVEADNLMLEGYFEKAIIKYQQCFDIYPSNDVLLKVNELKICVNKAETLLIKAKSQIEQNKPTAAHNFALEALEIYPQYDKAIILKKEIDELLIKQSKEIEFGEISKKAETLFTNEKLEEALATFKMALEIFPNDFNTLTKIKEVENAIQQYEIKIQISNLVNQALNETKLGNLSKALSMYKQALILAPDDREIIIQIDDINQKSIELERKQKFNATLASADELLNQNQFKKSLELYKHCLHLYPDHKTIQAKINVCQTNISQQLLLDQYNSIIHDADFSFAQKEWNDAILKYQAATKLKDDESYPVQQIAVANTKLKEEELFSQLMSEGDQNWQSGFLQPSLKNYQDALVIFPNSNDLLKKIEQLEKEIEGQVAIEIEKKENKQRFEDYINKANQHYTLNNFDEAIKYYGLAKEIFPESNVPDIKIKEIRLIIAQSDQQNKFNELKSQADLFFEKKDFTKAIEAYRAVLLIQVKEAHCIEQIKLAQEEIVKIDLTQKYDLLLKSADHLFEKKNWKASIAEYEKAIQILPNEKYPFSQIALIQSFINLELSEKQKKADYNAFVEDGDKAFKIKDFDKAIELYHKAALLFKTEALTAKIDQALKAKADRAIQMQELEAQKALQLEFDHFILQAQNAEKTHEYQKAIEYYSKALAISSDNKDIKTAIQKLKDKLKASEILSKYEALVIKAEVSFSNKKFEEAQNYLKEAALLLPLTSQHTVLKDKIFAANKEKQLESEISNLVAEGQKLYNKGLKDEALKIFKQALSLSKNNNKTAAQFIENIQNELNQEKIALEITYLNADAENEVLQGNYDQAIRIFQSLCKKYPSDKGLKLRLEEILKLNLEKQNKEKEKQDKLAFDTLITETNQCVQEKKYKHALKLVHKALLIFPEHKSALDLKAHIEKLLKEEKSRIIPWYVHFSNFASANQKYLLTGIGLLAILGATYYFITKPKSEKLSGQLEIFRNAAGLFGCKLDEKEIVSASFDTLYMDTSNGLNGVRNDSVFSIKSDGALSLISYKEKETPPILTKDWIDSITDIDELYSLINQFPNHPLTPSINKRIKLLEEQKESKKYREILNISVLETKLAALEAFLREFPKSKLIKEINTEITETIDLIAKNLSEADLFNKAKIQNSIELFEKYLEKYPNGKYSDDAKTLLEKKHADDDHKAWEIAKNDAKSNNITKPLNDYLSQYKIHAQEAKALIVDIERINKEIIEQEEKERKEHAALWNSIKVREDLAEVRKFINDHSNSIFIKDAIALKEKLERPEIPDLIRDIESKMADFGGGSFNLGCDKGSNCDDDASPALKVNIKNIAISKYEVTQAEYEAIMGVNPSYFKDCPSCPVENVSFDDAIEYIRKLNALKGNPYKFRLPTEAEWEYFALANKNTLYAGSDDIDKVAQYGTKTGGTVKVKSKKPNNFGIYGMTGNVAEWCADYYHKDAYAKYSGKVATDPTPTRVVRGGSFKDNARFCKVKSRKSAPNDEKADWLGFRLVRENK